MRENNSGLLNGAGDMLAVTVNMSKARGGVWFSSYWDGTRTVTKSISAGDNSVK